MIPRRIMEIQEFAVHEAATGHGIGSEMDIAAIPVEKIVLEGVIYR